MLERLHNGKAFGWIDRATREAQARCKPDQSGVRVYRILPDDFAAYCKILHPLVEDNSAPSVSDHYYRDYHEGGPYRIDMEWLKHIGRLLSGAQDAPFPYRRVGLKELATRYGLQLVPEFSAYSLPRPRPRHRWGPGEGRLPMPIAQRLMTVLEPFTGKQLCYYYWQIWPPKEDDLGNPTCYRGRLTDATSMMDVENP